MVSSSKHLSVQSQQQQRQQKKKTLEESVKYVQS